MSSVLAPNAAMERIFGEGFYTEGPAAAPDGRIFFCDITPTFRAGMAAGNIWAFDPTSARSEIYRSPSGMASGIKFDSLGRMVVAGGADFGCRSIIRTDLESGRSHILAGLYNGRPFNAPNDLVIGRDGRIYFTDPRYFGHEAIEQPVFGVYRIDPDGSVHLILADVSKPNGIDLSPDERTLYVVEHDIRLLDRRHDAAPARDIGEMRILAYDLDAGKASRQRVLVDFDDEKGADGVAVDQEGNIYAAVQSTRRPGVRVYDSAGRQIEEILVPETPANLTLATRDGATWLYVTASRSVYRIATRIPEARRF